MKTYALTCNSCGGRLDKTLKCEHCGNQNILIDNEVVKAKPQQPVTEKYEFTVENINGVMKFTPESMSVKHQIGIIGIVSSKEMCSEIIVNTRMYCPIHYMTAFQSSPRVVQIPTKMAVSDINQFSFSGVPKNSKLEVVLYPLAK